MASYSDKPMKFNFRVPKGAEVDGKDSTVGRDAIEETAKGGSDDGESTRDEVGGSEESSESDSEKMSEEEMGAAVAAAQRSNNPTALYEAIAKIVSSCK